MKYIPATLNEASFHCPHCGVLAEQAWSDSGVFAKYTYDKPNGGEVYEAYSLTNINSAKCSHCSEISIWYKKKMVFPNSGNVEIANPDLPKDIKNDYNEARDIVNQSPRGAAALLRLAIQKLCIHLGEKGKNINQDIASLVKKGLPKTMQQALDSVRVIGNNAVHPGTIDLNDKAEIANSLFGFVNIICEVLISQPKKIEEFYNSNVPEGAKEGIKKRDKKIIKQKIK